MGRTQTDKNTYQVRLPQHIVEQIEETQGETNGEKLLNWIQKKTEATKNKKTPQDTKTTILKELQENTNKTTELLHQLLETNFQEQKNKLNNEIENKKTELKKEYFTTLKKFQTDIYLEKITPKEALKLLPELYQKIITDAELTNTTPEELLHDLGYSKKIQEIEQNIYNLKKQTQKIKNSYNNIDNLTIINEDIEQ